MNLAKIKKYLTKDILIVLFTNFVFADVLIFMIYFMAYSSFEFYSGNIFMEKYYLLIFFIIFFVPILRLFVLPILYAVLQKKSKDEVIQRFIYLLKTSNTMKIKVLFLSFIPTFIYTCILTKIDFIFTPKEWLIFILNFYRLLIFSIVFGLFGSYLVLYLYWYVEDKIKNYISKPNTLLSKFIILFKSLN